MTLPAWDTQRFGNKIHEILGEADRIPELAPTLGDTSKASTLDSLGTQDLLEGQSPKANPEAEGLKSGLYLYFDLLDKAHNVAQQIQGATGAYWHGIMHRREPDDGNSSYWFRQVGKHPALEGLGDALKVLGDLPADLQGLLFKKSGVWDPFGFIEACSRARKKPEAERSLLLNKIQLLEWRNLFEWSYKKAAGS